MANPLRDKLGWSAPSPDPARPEPSSPDSTVAKPAEFVVTVNDGMTDPRIWLEEQFAAIQAEQARRGESLQSRPEPDTASATELDAAALGAVDASKSPIEATEILHGFAGKDQPSSRSGGEAFSPGLAKVSARASSLLRSAKNAMSGALASAQVRAKTYAASMGRRAVGIFDRAKSSRTANENALSSPARTETGRSQMLIVAGAVLLVCGALLLGGGLLLRAGTPDTSATAEPIVWSFETPDEPLAERMIFTFSGPPQALRIEGLSISGRNTLSVPLLWVEGVIKPDTLQIDLPLILKVDGHAPPDRGPAGANFPLSSEVTATIPPRAPFKFVFTLPGEALNPKLFLDVYGGLTLSVRYEVDGKQRAVIQYLSPEILKAQLAEAEAEGS